jgi:hypothetical protein
MNYRLQQEDYEEYKDKPYSEYIKTFKLDPKLQQVILQAINDSEEGLNDATTEEGLASTFRYLRSLGKWGNSPLICPLYGGCSEISQAFCRSCAVYGGVYMLDQTISSLEFKEDKYHINCEYNFTSDHLITSIDYLQDMSNIETEDYHKAIIITDRSLQKNVDISIYVIPPKSMNNQNRIMLIQQGYEANCCPKSKYIVYLCTKATDSSKEELKYVISQLFDDKIDESEKSKVDVLNTEEEEGKKESGEKNNEEEEDEEEEEDDDDEEEEDDDDEETKTKPKAYLSVIFKQTIRKQKKSEKTDDNKKNDNITIIDDMLPGISMEQPVENSLTIFKQLCPEVEEIYASPKEEEEKEEEMKEEKQNTTIEESKPEAKAEASTEIKTSESN